MSLSLQRKVQLAFGAALVILAGIGAAAYRTLWHATEASRMVRHTHEVLASLAAVEQDVTDAETGQRGFLLTGDGEFLGPYNLALRSIERDTVRLRRLVADDGERAARADTLAALVAQRLSMLRENLARAHDGRRDLALASVRAGRGLVLMVQVRAALARMRAMERTLLDERAEEQRHRERLAAIVIIVGFLVAVGVVSVALLTIRRDLQERERVAAELERALFHATGASRAKSDFLARMSHELRTPLNSVIGFASILLKNKRGTLSEQDLSYLSRIHANGTHLLGIINDILDLSKVESGRMDVALTHVDVAALLGETVEQLGQREVPVEQELPRYLAPLRTDRDKLKQVLLNLLGNAVKFTDRGRILVRVVAEPHGGRIQRIDIVDTGIGIAAERIHAVFEAFEQADVTTSRRFGGTGLGLAIARSMCERLGFRLVAVSEPGVGATFSILCTDDAVPPAAHVPPGPPTPAAPVAVTRTGEHRLPTASRASSIASRDGGGGADGPRPTVLVIDDGADTRLLLSQYLDDAGFEVLAANSGEQGLDMALELHPDLITLDLMMPGMDGWDVLRRLKTHPSTSATPVIIVSIVASDQRGSMVGAVDLVDKPIVRDELIQAVRRNLSRTPARVLVVEDSPDARRLFEAYLADYPGVEVRAVASGEAGLAVLDRWQPDLVLLDLMLPEMDGLGFIACLRADDRFVDVPVVVATAKMLEPDEQRELERQTLTVVQKGARLEDDLRRVLRSAVRIVRHRQTI